MQKKTFLARAVIVFALVMAVVMIFSSCALFTKNYVVGKNIESNDISEFYYTISSSTNPPEYQRYLFSMEDGKYMFFHETREGDHWPLTEEDATVSGKFEISEEDWNEFVSCITGGTVVARTNNPAGGGRGPYLYLYWTKDKGKYQEFSFASYDALLRFESLCVRLTGN